MSKAEQTTIVNQETEIRLQRLMDSTNIQGGIYFKEFKVAEGYLGEVFVGLLPS